MFLYLVSYIELLKWLKGPIFTKTHFKNYEIDYFEGFQSILWRINEVSCRINEVKFT